MKFSDTFYTHFIFFAKINKFIQRLFSFACFFNHWFFLKITSHIHPITLIVNNIDLYYTYCRKFYFFNSFLNIQTDSVFAMCRIIIFYFLWSSFFWFGSFSELEGDFLSFSKNRLFRFCFCFSDREFFSFLIRECLPSYRLTRVEMKNRLFHFIMLPPRVLNVLIATRGAPS